MTLPLESQLSPEAQRIRADHNRHLASERRIYCYNVILATSALTFILALALVLLVSAVG